MAVVGEGGYTYCSSTCGYARFTKQHKKIVGKCILGCVTYLLDPPILHSMNPSTVLVSKEQARYQRKRHFHLMLRQVHPRIYWLSHFRTLNDVGWMRSF